MNQSNILSPLLYLWLPLGLLIIQCILELTLPGETLSLLLSEHGPHELAQAAIIFIALLVAIHALTHKEIWHNALLRFWFALAALCCLYVTGEELSWGQQVFNWATPDYWQNVNDQQETNFHNTSSWLDQKPRLLLEISIIIGGLLIPLLKRFKPHILPTKFSALYPQNNMIPLTLMIIVPKLIEKGGEAFDITTFARVSEVQELYMFYFVLLYLWTLKKQSIQNNTM